MKVRSQAIVAALALGGGLWLGAAKATPVQAHDLPGAVGASAQQSMVAGDCTGCGIIGDPHIESDGVSCNGNTVSLRIQFTNTSAGECADTPNCDGTLTPCHWDWDIQYESECCIFITGTECGHPIFVPVQCLPAASTWTTAFSSSADVRCGHSCTLAYHIFCDGCPNNSVTLNHGLGCEQCMHF
jgi:hypothetical protein